MTHRVAQRIARVALMSACIACATRAQETQARIDAYLRARPGGAFSGVIVVARGDSILAQNAYGLANADLGTPNSVDHRFNIGSLTKPITATAVLRLVQEGRLRLTDEACGYLRLCPARWRHVTVRHLLSHTSGIPDLFGELPAARADSLRSVVDAALQRHSADTLRFPPGTRYAYSNFNDVWRIVRGRVRGYERDGDQLRNTDYHDHAAYTAGGLLSSAADLLRFSRALSSGQLLSDSLVRVMETPGLGDYALGWQVIGAFGRRLRNHTGGVTGFASHLARYDDGTTIVVLSNVESEPAKATACDIAAIIFGLEPSSRQGNQIPCRPAP